jgi:phosphate transport system permease protein
MDKDNKNNNKDNTSHKSIVQAYVVKNSRKRKIVNNLITVILFTFVVIAIIPLTSILIEVFRNGAAALSQ